jgi:hypothetical protein
VAAPVPFIPESTRYRLFFDETGNGDLKAAKKDANQRYHSLTGLVVRLDIHNATVAPLLTTLKKDIFGEKNATVVLHRREIMDKSGIFAALKDDELRAKFDAQFAGLVASIPAVAFTVSIDKEAHLENIRFGNSVPITMPLLVCLSALYFG